MNKPRFHLLLIALVGLLVYSNTFFAPFHLDDTRNIVENPLIKSFEYFTDPSMAQGLEIYSEFQSRFIGYLSFALNYRLHGLDVTGYHIVNLTIHIINALLVYWLVLLTFRTPYFSRIPAFSVSSTLLEGNRGMLVALFSALLFVSHPIQTQAVTYIVQRLASLATMFYLFALVMYIEARQRSLNKVVSEQNKSYKLKLLDYNIILPYLASVVCSVLAMKTKEIAFTLPVIITFYEFMFFQGKIRTRLLYLLPLLLTMLIIPLTLLSAAALVGEIIGDMGEAARLQSALSREDYLFTQFRVIVTYIRLIFLPINQNLDYDYPIYHSFFETEIMLSFLFLLSIVCLALYLLHRSRLTPSEFRLTAFGIFWFFITLSVESSIIPIKDVIFEHRVYLPSVGIFTAIASIVCITLAKIINKQQQEKTILFLMTTIIFTLLLSTVIRNSVWDNGFKLWKDVLDKSPDKARPHFQIGYLYFKQKQYYDAAREFQAATQLAYRYPDAHYNLGVALRKIGRVEDAMREFEIVLQIEPESYHRARYILGEYYLNQDRLEDAIFQFQTYLKKYPLESNAHNNLGRAYLKQGRIRDAIHEFQAALMMSPDFEDARLNMNKAQRLLKRTN